MPNVTAVLAQIITRLSKRVVNAGKLKRTPLGGKLGSEYSVR